MPIDYEAMKRQARTNDKEFYRCPDAWCPFQGMMTKGDIRTHYAREHACGRCKANLHRKCKGEICGCPHRWDRAHGGKAVLVEAMKLAAQIEKKT